MATPRRANKKTTSTSNVDKDDCGTCSLVVAERDKALQCDLCELWFHASCEKIDSATYELIKKDSKKGRPAIHWYCSKQCNIVAAKYLGGVTHLERKVNVLTEKVAKVDQSVAGLKEGKLPQNMIEAVKVISQQYVQNPPDTEEQRTIVKEIIAERENDQICGLKDIISSKEREHMEEIEERVGRRNNLMLFGLPENRTENKEERTERDEEQLKTLLDEVRVAQRPVEIRRIGRFQESDSSKLRPLRITFSSESARDEVLKAYHRVRRSDKQLASTENQEDCV